MSTIAIDFGGDRYQPPGIYTEDVGAPQLRPQSSVPQSVAIFGMTRGYRIFTESLKINPDTGEITTVQTITATGSPTSFTLTLDSEVTSSITTSSATGSTLRTALEGLPGVVPDDIVSATGVAGGPWEITFVGEVSAVTGTPSGGSSPAILVNRVLAGTPAVNRTLAKQGIKTDSVVVRNVSTGQQYSVNTDYSVVRVSAGDDTLTNTRDDLYTISRVIDGGHIDPGDTVQVDYNYTDPKYFEVYNFYDWDDIRDFYGPSFNSDGTIQSEITLAAELAIKNGASTIMAVAVDPANPSSPTTGDYSNALDKLRDEDQIAVIVPATGDQALHALVQSHVSSQSENKYERRAILGLDGSTTPVISSARIVAAQTITDKRVALVSPATFDYYAADLNRSITFGGQYVAAALAGITVKNNASWPLTRKVVRGIKAVTESQRDGAKNLESQNGLMVVELNKRNLIWVRHGVSTDPSSLQRREWSVTGQQDVMIYRIRDYLDADQLIGQPILPETIINTKASAVSALESLVRDKIIWGYRELKIRQIGDQPDVLEIRFSWRPSWPLNYIVVRYSIDTTTGDVTDTDVATTA